MEGDTPEVKEVRSDAREENEPKGEREGRAGRVPVTLPVPPWTSDGLPTMVTVRVASNESRGAGVLVISGVKV